ncbi:hypothetical protein OK016_08160 [Vibrio chagasii]|nr:hypothetical protein [Vibrio chagasii]
MAGEFAFHSYDRLGLPMNQHVQVVNTLSIIGKYCWKLDGSKAGAVTFLLRMTSETKIN